MAHCARPHLDLKGISNTPKLGNIREVIYCIKSTQRLFQQDETSIDMATFYLALFVTTVAISLGQEKPDCNTADFHGCMPIGRCSEDAVAYNMTCGATSVCCDFRSNKKDPCRNVFGGECLDVTSSKLPNCLEPNAAMDTCGEGKHCCVNLAKF